ncbi:MAG: pyridoxal phosphate-dependent aminotransferase [Opitutales bacterium]|nr:pyridoxal phosphate-dependent aminotransferase [Opitutales bacterium]
MFSERFHFSPKPNRWTRVLRAVREEGCDLLDLAVSNPTAAGFSWDAGTLLAALGNEEVSLYRPSSRGERHSREAVADFYKTTHRAAIAPAQIHLTASTSEAYTWILKLLCDPGDNVLVPAPSYPLISLLCSIESVRTNEWRLDWRRERWKIDFESLAAACDARTKAIFCVSPNNPTGNVIGGEEREQLLAFARERHLPLVTDEVFLEYGDGGNAGESFATARDGDPLVFVLGGLSKTAALPQIKAGWIVTVGGNAKEREGSLERLDFIADSFLSVSTTAALAVPELLKRAPEMRARIAGRLQKNFEQLQNWCARSRDGRQLLPREGGWYGIVRLPRGIDEERLCTDLLRHGNVIVHPGYFYDLDASEGGHLVFSLLAPEKLFELAFPRIDYAIGRN